MTAGQWRPTEPPLRISRVSAVYWVHRGIDARQADLPVTVCPFNPDESVTDFFLAHWWIKGWRRGVTDPTGDTVGPQ